MHKLPETVTASEIADYVFWPEPWRLNALGAQSANQPQKDAGTQHHSNLGCAERVAGGSITLGWWLVAAVLIVLGLLCATL